MYLSLGQLTLHSTHNLWHQSHSLPFTPSHCVQASQEEQLTRVRAELEQAQAAQNKHESNVCKRPALCRARRRCAPK